MDFWVANHFLLKFWSLSSYHCCCWQVSCHSHLWVFICDHSPLSPALTLDTFRIFSLLYSDILWYCDMMVFSPSILLCTFIFHFLEIFLNYSLSVSFFLFLSMSLPLSLPMFVSPFFHLSVLFFLSPLLPHSLFSLTWIAGIQLLGFLN